MTKWNALLNSIDQLYLWVIKQLSKEKQEDQPDLENEESEAEDLAKALQEIQLEEKMYKAEEKKARSHRKYLESEEDTKKCTLKEKCLEDKDLDMVKMRSSNRVVVSDEQTAVDFCKNNGMEDCIRYSEPELNKRAVHRYLENGIDIPGVILEEHETIHVKENKKGKKTK